MHRIATERHRHFLLDAAVRGGCAPMDAEIVAGALLWADLHGRHEQGLIRLSNLVERLRHGVTRSPVNPDWTVLGPAGEHLDAHHGIGFVAGYRAMQRAVELARSECIGVVTVEHSSHYGSAAYYCELAARADCIALTCTNSYAKVAPFGGSKAALGTNPLAFGCPTLDGRPILVDLSTSAVAGSAARRAADVEAELPPASALDATGQPTTDPAAAAAGALLPAAGAKGYALALMIEVLTGVLSGGAMGKQVGSIFALDRPVDVAHFFLAIHVASFMPVPLFKERLHMLASSIRSSPALEPSQLVRLPGEIRADLAERYSREGIPYTEAMRQAAQTLAAELSIAAPWEIP